jgi:hypothetical protein
LQRERQGNDPIPLWPISIDALRSDHEDEAPPLPRELIKDNGPVEPALGGPDIGDVGRPFLLRRLDDEALVDQVPDAKLIDIIARSSAVMENFILVGIASQQR